MRKTCEVCPNEFEAKRPSAKYCGERCKKRAQRRPGGVTARPVPDVPVADAPPAVPLPSQDAGTGPVEAAAMAELQDAERARSSAGQAVLALARRIDGGSRETGSAMASLVREYRATLAAALEGAKRAADPLDELRSRRERKLSVG